MIATETYWDILKGKLPLPKVLAAFGYSEDNISLTMNDLKQEAGGGVWGGWSLSLQMAHEAYLKLVELKEISDDVVFSLNEKPSLGDIGFKGNDLYRFHNEWIKFTT